jgi:hypothetical protein
MRISRCELLPELHQILTTVLYCRWADDLGDEIGDEGKPAFAEWWRVS